MQGLPIMATDAAGGFQKPVLSKQTPSNGGPAKHSFPSPQKIAWILERDKNGFQKGPKFQVIGEVTFLTQ